MNAEGLLRLAAIVRWTGRGLGAAAVAFFVWLPAAAGGAYAENWFLLVGAGLGIAAVIIIITTAVAWMIEGYAKPRE
ncbi:MAG: hypothetical protein OEZ08_05705 [Betaproteobacteria bacterium]|nr:hypothetical protein [Betaproteobacteria bacterium]